MHENPHRRGLLRRPQTASVLSGGAFIIKGMPPTRGSTATSEASLLSELDRSELGRLWAVTLRDAYLRALDDSRANAARRMLDDNALRAIHAEFRRRELLAIEEQSAY